MSAGRNDPCPCGSGRKYKKCHLAADEARHAAAAGKDASPLHAMDHRLVEEMIRFAGSRFPAEMKVFGEFPSLGADPQSMQFLVPWAVYVEPVRGRRVVDWFVESRGWSLSPGEIEWLEAQRRSWLSVWEVLDVDRG